jgi:hypothetical protein
MLMSKRAITTPLPAIRIGTVSVGATFGLKLKLMRYKSRGYLRPLSFGSEATKWLGVG